MLVTSRGGRRIGACRGAVISPCTSCPGCRVMVECSPAHIPILLGVFVCLKLVLLFSNSDLNLCFAFNEIFYLSIAFANDFCVWGPKETSKTVWNV